MCRRATTTATACVALLFAALPARGHDLPRERTMLVEFSETGVEAMVVYREPPGRRVDLLKSQFDVDGDGRLTGAEAEAAGETWLEYALQDLEIRIDGEIRDRSTTKVKFRNEHNGALSAAIYLDWRVPELSAGESRELEIERSPDAPDFTSLVRTQVRDDLRLVDGPGSGDPGGAGPFELSPGARLEFRFRRTEDSFSLPTRRP